MVKIHILKSIRLTLLNFARKIATREGLTMCEIKNIAGTNYIVAKDGTYYAISRNAEKVQAQNREHNLKLIK
jgi:hypothetical protein